MDPRQQYPGSITQGGSSYPPNGSQTENFNTFVNTDDTPGFDPSWNSQLFTNQQQPNDGFDPGVQAWQQDAYQNPGLLPMPDYGIQPQGYDQAYARSPASFNYSGYNSNASHAFPQSVYENTFAYEEVLMNDRFDYTGQSNLGRPNPNQTISPQALQTYSSFPQNSLENNHQPPNVPYESNVQVQGGSGLETPLASLTHQEWMKFSTPTTNSISRGGLHIKPTGEFSNATSSSRLDGFIFVANDSIALDIVKAPTPRHKRKKSRTELIRLLHREKGTDPWHREREPLMKRLKVAATKLSGPRPGTSAILSRSGSAANSASSSDSSDSESDDESLDSEESDIEVRPEEPSPLPSIRPADPSKAVEYDVIKTVWAKRSTALPGTVIRTALGEYWGIFKGIRDKWKAKSTSLQQAIEKKDQANKTAYERRVVEQRRLLESCIRLTLKHGHPSIVEKLGENPILLAIFYAFIADRFKDSEYTGSLIASILELMTRCVTVDTALLEKTKIDKILPRIVKRGDDQGKRLAQQVLHNATNVAGQKSVGGRPVSTPHMNGASETKSVESTARLQDANDGKKERPADVKRTSAELASEKINTTWTIKPANGLVNRQVNTKGDAKPASQTAGVDASKVKVNHVVAKPSGFFSSLQSASKKPGTSTKMKDVKPSAVSETKSEVVTPAPKPAFSFAATMADLAKQKEAPPAKLEDTRKPETPEERRKRIRKEQRRKLRVSFKADDDLVKIREFVHDPEEELGHEDSQVRDVGDTKGEGQMLKMHKDLEVMDDDDEYEPPDTDEILPPWTTPQAVDFSAIEDEELKRNYTSRGGRVEIKSEERGVQEQRELSTLMVVYASYSDIPPSPREPTDSRSGENVIEKGFGQPDEVVKSREAEYHARQNSRNQPTTTSALPMADMSAIFRIISQVQQPQQEQQQQPQPLASALATSNQLEAIFAKFSNSGQQQAPQVQMAPQPPTAPAFNLQAALASMSQSNQSQQPYQAPQNYGAPPQAQAPDLHAILAQFGNQRAPQAQPMQGYGFNANPYQAENDRKRQYDNDQDDYASGQGKRLRGGAVTEKKKYQGVPRLPCKFWQEGKCRKGEECTFLHE